MTYGIKNEVTRDIKNQIRSNMNLLKFLYYVDEVDKDITLLPDLTPTQIRDVVDNYIYDYQKVEANRDTDKRCYISLSYGIKQYHALNNPYFNGNSFDIYIMCAREVDYNKINGSRINAIEQCIADIFEDGDVGCVGKSRIDISEPANIRGSEYVGIHISIIFYDAQLKNKDSTI